MEPMPAWSIMFCRLVEHAADTINRAFASLSHDGKVPYKRLNSWMPNLIQAEFGEQVWAKVPTYLDKRKQSLKPRSPSVAVK